MEKNNFNKAYMYIVGIFAIGIAIANVISFFSGVGFALIGASVLLFLAISNILKSEQKKRFGDIFVLIILEFIMFVVLFFAYDFNINGLTNDFPLVMRNICAIYSMLALGYVLFRYISEVKGKKYNFVEYMLGNYTPEARAKKSKPSKAEIKKNKELENGTLEPKPSSVENNAVRTEDSATDIAVDENETANETIESAVETDTNNAEAVSEQTSEDNTEPTETNAQQTVSQQNDNSANRNNYWY